MISALYEEALTAGNEAIALADLRFQELAQLLPPVTPVRVGVELQPRFAERLPEQAILLKVARQISVTSFILRAVESGNLHEQAILQRIADEAGEDVTFLAMGMRSGLNKTHRKFLAGFWNEDFVDDGTGPKFTYTPQVPRKEIRQYIEKNCNSLGVEGRESAARTLYGVMSGYVHGSAGYALELFDKRNHRFRLTGAFDRAQQLPYLMNAVNYPYRAVMSVVHADHAICRGSANLNLWSGMKRYETWLADFDLRAQTVADSISFPVA